MHGDGACTARYSSGTSRRSKRVIDCELIVLEAHNAREKRWSSRTKMNQSYDLWLIVEVFSLDLCTLELMKRMIITTKLSHHWLWTHFIRVILLEACARKAMENDKAHERLWSHFMKAICTRRRSSWTTMKQAHFWNDEVILSKPCARRQSSWSSKKTERSKVMIDCAVIYIEPCGHKAHQKRWSS